MSMIACQNDDMAMGARRAFEESEDMQERDAWLRLPVTGCDGVPGIASPISGTKSLTGCLQAGDQPGQFSLTGVDGKVWALRSDVVKLNAHVGHEVTATGYARATKRQENTENKDGQVVQAATREDYGDLRVASVKMVSDNCSK